MQCRAKDGFPKPTFNRLLHK